jgi:hypothetical protein
VRAGVIRDPGEGDVLHIAGLVLIRQQRWVQHEQQLRQLVGIREHADMKCILTCTPFRLFIDMVCAPGAQDRPESCRRVCCR